MNHSLKSYQTEDILNALCESRIKDIIKEIAKEYNIDSQKLLQKYTNKNIIETKFQKRSSNVPQNKKCMARVWNEGKGGQCTRKGTKGNNNDLCGNHLRCIMEKGQLPNGRIDEEIPENMIQQKIICPIKITQNNETTEKKKRGRPKGSKNDNKNNQEIIIEEKEEILKEEEIKSCVSQNEIQNCIKDYLQGADIKQVNINTTIKAIEKKLSIKSSDYDKKWFQNVFETQLQQHKDQHQHQHQDQDQQEPDENESDSEEVACQEITVENIVYLLDPESMKIYQRESPNAFIGKYDGSKIDFEAQDSDAESDDEE